MEFVNPFLLADTTGEISYLQSQRRHTLPTLPRLTVPMKVSRKDACKNKLASSPKTPPVRPRKRIIKAAVCQKQDGRSLSFHMYTVWLFTRSDLKTVMFPQIAVALFNALSERVLSSTTTSNISDISFRVVLGVVWIWINLLFEVIANQRLHYSIVEDKINKPWRPIPSRRLNPDEAHRLLIAVIPCVVLVSWLLGVTAPSIGLIALTWPYTDLGGADEHYFIRNLLNASGLLCFGAGANVYRRRPDEPTPDT